MQRRLTISYRSVQSGFRPMQANVTIPRPTAAFSASLPLTLVLQDNRTKHEHVLRWMVQTAAKGTVWTASRPARKHRFAPT